MININQESVKELLLKLETCDTDFKVIFSGKKSNKVNGLYKQDINEIVIHNKNFKNDNKPKLVKKQKQLYTSQSLIAAEKIDKEKEAITRGICLALGQINEGATIKEVLEMSKIDKREAIECKVPEIDIERLEDIFNEIK